MRLLVRAIAVAAVLMPLAVTLSGADCASVQSECPGVWEYVGSRSESMRICASTFISCDPPWACGSGQDCRTEIVTYDVFECREVEGGGGGGGGGTPPPPPPPKDADDDGKIDCWLEVVDTDKPQTTQKSLGTKFGGTFEGDNGCHSGQDVDCNIGDPVYATCSGKVEKAGAAGNNGTMVRIKVGSSVYCDHLHLNDTAIQEGATVKAGQLIGYCGQTGKAGYPHVHIRKMLKNPALTYPECNTDDMQFDGYSYFDPTAEFPCP